MGIKEEIEKFRAKLKTTHVPTRVHILMDIYMKESENTCVKEFKMRAPVILYFMCKDCGFKLSTHKLRTAFGLKNPLDLWSDTRETFNNLVSKYPRQTHSEAISELRNTMNITNSEHITLHDAIKTIQTPYYRIAIVGIFHRLRAKTVHAKTFKRNIPNSFSPEEMVNLEKFCGVSVIYAHKYVTKLLFANREKPVLLLKQHNLTCYQTPSIQPYLVK